ncbi:MAG: N-acetylmannosamine-6-phosphate 2-epimerase [Clostridia bacterium]
MASLKKGGLIVSCQAVEGEVLHGYNIMHLMAKCAVEGGASGIRANSVSDVNSIKSTVDVPTIAIIKKDFPNFDVRITPTREELEALLLQTKADVIALDATLRPRPNGENLADLVAFARKIKPETELMADIATMDEALFADKLGFDYIGCTLRGYTAETKGISIPDYDFVRDLVKNVKAKVIAEGGIWEVGQLKKVLECGVYSVVIGTAITRPFDITKRFVKVMEEK